MDLGNKIQFYRKKLGMSQEELGNKLFVSRQTVSLWEKGQTVPAIENLIRLKEIFGISMDELVLSDNNACKSIKSSAEVYSFRYTDDELNQLYKLMIQPIINRCIRFFIIIISFILFYILSSSSDDNSDNALIFLMGILIIGGTYYFKSIYSYKKAWKKGKAKLTGRIYEYHIFENYFTLTVDDDNGCSMSQTVNFRNIEKVYNYSSYFLISSFDQLFILKKEKMNQDSLFCLFLNSKTPSLAVTPQDSMRKAVSVILNIFSWISPYIGFFLSVTAAENSNDLTGNMWHFLVVIPIPLLSLIFYIIARKKGRNFKSNLISGLAVLIILCIFGLFTFIFHN